MKILLLTLLLINSSYAQDLSNPELEFYEKSPVNKEEYSPEDLEKIQQAEEEYYPEDYDEQLWREENAIELQEMEEDYVE